MKFGKRKLIAYLESLLKKKTDSYLCIDRNMVKAIVELLRE